MHMTKVLFLVLAGNSALTMGFYWSYTLFTLVARSYALLSHVYQWIQNPNLCKVATAGMKREKKSHDRHSDNVLYCRAAIKVEITEPRH